MRRYVFVKASVVAAISPIEGSSVATLPFALRLNPLRAASVHDEVRTLGSALPSVDRSFLPGRPRLGSQSPDPGRSGEPMELATEVLISYLWALSSFRS